MDTPQDEWMLEEGHTAWVGELLNMCYHNHSGQELQAMINRAKPLFYAQTTHDLQLWYDTGTLAQMMYQGILGAK